MSLLRFGCALWISAFVAFTTPSGAAAGIIGYWRFEGDATGFVSDSSGNGRTLTLAGTTVPSQYTLPTSGNGSAFPDPVPINSLANGSAANIAGGTNSSRFTRADDAAFTDTTFTVEAFINGSDFDTSNNAQKSIIGQWNSTGNQRSWLFTVDGNEKLNLLISSDGGSTNQNVIVASLPALVSNNDYYVAVSFDLADTSATGITFYLQDLTANGALQSAGATHALTTLKDSSSSLTIGATAQPSSPFKGLIDEVRYSDEVLASDQLLVTPVPEPGTLVLLSSAALAGFVALRRRLRARA